MSCNEASIQRLRTNSHKEFKSLRKKKSCTTTILVLKVRYRFDFSDSYLIFFFFIKKTCFQH